MLTLEYPEFKIDVQNNAVALLHRAAEEAAREARIKVPKAFGSLAASIRVEQLNESTFAVVVGQSYGGKVEFGTNGGGWVQREIIESWIKKKGIQPNNPDMSIRQLGFLIARKIFQVGTRPQPYLSIGGLKAQEFLKKYNNEFQFEVALK
jgi:hypothetical protein